MPKFTTKEFAEKVGLTHGRIVQLIQDGTIQADRLGRDYFINESYIAIIKSRPERRGRRPKKASKGVISA
jgi:excisionase family DNA binding protein